ncbi:MAG: hypothetical protein E3J94_05965 [Desulfobacteraceae bacterium]|nr:MAG: hypothetical protein E3J94_05965 [Desulfobacteraceae bacterium]
MTIKLKGLRSDSSTVVRVAVIYSEEALSSYRGLPENTNYCEKKSIKNIRRESFEYNEYSKEGTIELPAVKHGYCVVALFVDYDGDCILDEKKDIRKIAKGNIPFWFISSLRFPEELGSKNNPIKFNF